MTLGGRELKPGEKLPTLHDFDQPFPFEVSFYPRRARLEFYDTSSPENYSLLQPSVIVLCFSISDPGSLDSIQTQWKTTVETHFNQDENIPVILLGLKRDVRGYSDYHGQYVPMANGLNGSTRTFLYPQEALKIAQEMRLDCYCECSPLTGEVRSHSLDLYIPYPLTRYSSVAKYLKISAR